MKKLITWCSIAMLVGTLSGQTIGWNGQGAMEHSTKGDWELLQMFDFTTIGRYPGGADTKFTMTGTDPVIRGWDFNIDTIERHFALYGTDENDGEDGIDKFRRKYETQEGTSIDYHKRLAAMSQFLPNHQIMYNFNTVYNGNAKCMVQLDSLIARGANVTAVVFNNECYNKTQYNFEFEAYRADFEQWAVLIKQRYPYISIGLCLAPDIDSRFHQKFNDGVFNYIAQHPELIDAVDMHQYFSEKELPLSNQAMPTVKQVVRFDVKDAVLDNAWQVFYDEATANKLIDKNVAYIRGKSPSVKIWCSEFNAKPLSRWCNTVSHGAFLYRKLMENAPQFEYFMVHNGIGSDVGSMISMRQEQDLGTDTNSIRTHYYSFLFAGIGLQQHAVEINTLKIDAPGVYYAWYAQIQDSPTIPHPEISDRLEVSTITNVFVQGEFTYTSSGVLSLMKRVRDGQEKSNEIDGYFMSDNDTIAPNSFGLIVYQVSNKIICRDTMVLDRYDTIWQNTIDLDTIWRPECEDCDRFFYRLSHRFICRLCKWMGPYDIVAVEVKTPILVPVYKTVEICN